jgi:hypothetical protein
MLAGLVWDKVGECAGQIYQCGPLELAVAQNLPGLVDDNDFMIANLHSFTKDVS